MSVIDDNRALGQQYFAMVQQGEIDRPELFVSPLPYHTPTGLVTDLEGAKMFLNVFVNAFPDHFTTIEDEIVTEDKLIFRWRTEGTHKGDLLGVPGSGRSVTLIGATFMHVADGKIQEMWELADFFGAFQQIGAFPPAG